MEWFRKKPKELSEVQKKEKEFGRQCICGHYKADHTDSKKRGLSDFTYANFIPNQYFFTVLSKKLTPDDKSCILCNCSKYSRKKK